MKLEIEITEEEIKSAIERKIRVAIANGSNTWKNEKAIKDTVEKYWAVIIEKEIQEQLAHSDVMRVTIRALIEAKLRAQIAKLMNG